MQTSNEKTKTMKIETQHQNVCLFLNFLLNFQRKNAIFRLQNLK